MKTSLPLFSQPLKTALYCTLFFAVVGPLIGSMVVFILYVLDVVFGNAHGSIGELPETFKMVFIFGYILGVVPAALTGFACSLNYVFGNVAKTNNFKYLNVFITTVIGTIVTFVIFWGLDLDNERPLLTMMMAAVPSIACSLMFFKHYTKQK